MSETKASYEKLFANVTEELEPREATIEGAVPEWLSGTLLRNGPGIFSVGPDEYSHFFDGLAILNRFFFKDGKVYHSSRFLRSDAYEKNMAAQRIVVSEFGTMAVPDPCKNIFSRYLSYFFPGGDLTDNDVVHYVLHGDGIYASSETGILHKVDPVSLDSLGKVSVKKHVTLNTATAHPHYDADGTYYNVGTGYGGYKIIAVPPPTPRQKDPYETARVVGSIPVKLSELSYYHSFAMSANYFILPAMPLRFNPLKMMTAPITRTPYSQALSWKPDEKAVFHVMRRSDGVLVDNKYVADAFFTFHHANTFEQDDCIIMDVCGYPDGSAVQTLTIQDLKEGKLPLAQSKNGEGNLWRFVLPLNVPEDAVAGTELVSKAAKTLKTKAKAVVQEDGSIKLTHELIGDKYFEFPRYNYDAVNAKPYRFLYGTTFDEGMRGDKVVKLNVETGESQDWDTNSKTLFPGEPVFVPRRGATAEDDGVVLTVVSETESGESCFLLILDGQSFEELCRAKVRPMMPLGFHGVFLPQT